MNPEIEGFEMLRDAAAIVAGIPENRFDLQLYMDPCGTIGCAAGWLALHPKFKSLVQEREKNLVGVMPARPNGAHLRGLIADNFRSWGKAWNLFGMAGECGYDKEPECPKSHKGKFLYRVMRFLDDHGQPVSDEFRAFVRTFQ